MNSYERKPYTFDRVIRITFTVISIIAILYVLDALKGVLLPFLVSCLIAYLLEPMVKWNMRWTHLKSRFIPVMLTLLEALILLTAFCILFVPYLITEAEEMADMVKNYASSKIEIPYISQAIQKFIKENIDFEGISRLLTSSEWKDLIKSALASSWNFLSSSLAFIIGLFSWLIVILYVIFIMLDYEKIMNGFRRMVPKRHRPRVYKVANDIEMAMNRYFRGQFFIAFSVGILFSIGFVIVGLPMGVVVGLFIGMLNMVPYLQLISIPITALLCLVDTASTGIDFWVIFWECMAVYCVVQIIQDLFLTPKIMGKAMGLNPAIILLSLSVWGSVLGFMGLIIALPLTTLLISYYNTYIVNRYSDPSDSEPEQT